MVGKEPVFNREELLEERKKIISNLVLLLTAFFVVLLALGTMAWFKIDKEVKSDGLQISIVTPEGIQISLGETGVTTDGVTTDLKLNNPDDLLLTEHDDSGNGWKVLEPRNNVAGEDYDWAERIYVGNYYSFGKLIPASSTSGEHIFFTPDAVKTGRELRENARFYLSSGDYAVNGSYVSDGKTDGALKRNLGKLAENEQDEDYLMTTAHAYTSSEEKQAIFWDGYRGRSAWYDTNDDGYFADVPFWLRSNCRVSVQLGVEGYITKKDGTIVSADYDDERNALYKAVRVAFFVWSDAENKYIPAAKDKNGVARNVIPLQNALSFGETTQTIVDSKNYTITRDSLNARDDDALYAMQPADETENGLVQEQNYMIYQSYGKDAGSEIAPAIAVLGAAVDSSVNWSEARKMLLRVWLDGDDEDCRNATAGQDWCINLRFFILENQQ